MSNRCAFQKFLKAYRFLILFRIVDLTQLAYSVQKFVLDFLAAVGFIHNGPFMPDTAKAQCKLIGSSEHLDCDP